VSAQNTELAFSRVRRRIHHGRRILRADSAKQPVLQNVQHGPTIKYHISDNSLPRQCPLLSEKRSTMAIQGRVR
jgi:hypothetical protein